MQVSSDNWLNFSCSNYSATCAIRRFYLVCDVVDLNLDGGLLTVGEETLICNTCNLLEVLLRYVVLSGAFLIVHLSITVLCCVDRVSSVGGFSLLAFHETAYALTIVETCSINFDHVVDSFFLRGHLSGYTHAWRLLSYLAGTGANHRLVLGVDETCSRSLLVLLRLQLDVGSRTQVELRVGHRQRCKDVLWICVHLKAGRVCNLCSHIGLMRILQLLWKMLGVTWYLSWVVSRISKEHLLGFLRADTWHDLVRCEDPLVLVVDLGHLVANGGIFDHTST